MFNTDKQIFDTNLMSEVVSSSNLEAAFESIYKKRKKLHYNNSIWHLSQNWATIKKEIQLKLLNNSYNIEPLKILKIDGQRLCVWSAIDAVTLKAISIVLSKHLTKKLNPDVYHMAGNGGVPGAINKLKSLLSNDSKEVENENTKQYNHMIKSDIAKFYASTDHNILLKECKKYIKDKRILNIIMQYAARLEDVNGQYIHITKGISRGCSLSPLMGAIILKSLDYAMLKIKNVAYLRYMDDWIILTKTKNQLRKCIKIMHNVISKLKYKLAIDKTFIGKVTREFKFLGQCFDSYSM